jgi:hypothetical protein
MSKTLILCLTLLRLFSTMVWAEEAQLNGANTSWVLIPITLNYCPFMLVTILHDSVALNANSQLLLNRAPCPDLFFLYTARPQI